MPSHIDETIYIDDIDEQEEMSLDSWRVTYNWYQRLLHQGARQEITSSMVEISNHLAAAHNLLKQIRSNFAPRDGVPE